MRLSELGIAYARKYTHLHKHTHHCSLPNCTHCSYGAANLPVTTERFNQMQAHVQATIDEVMQRHANTVHKHTVTASPILSCLGAHHHHHHHYTAFHTTKVADELLAEMSAEEKKQLKKMFTSLEDGGVRAVRSLRCIVLIPSPLLARSPAQVALDVEPFADRTTIMNDIDMAAQLFQEVAGDERLRRRKNPVRDAAEAKRAEEELSNKHPHQQAWAQKETQWRAPAGRGKRARRKR